MNWIKKINNFIPLLLVLLFLLACETDTQTDNEQASSTISEGGIADIIRNPVTANEEMIDTSAIAKLRFTKKIFEFGEVDAGAVLQHTFAFTNTGAVPLVISDVRSTCGCTVADWPRRPIMPGEKGEIPVRFDTKNKNGRQSKPITITANTYPNKTTVYMNGRVYGADKN